MTNNKKLFSFIIIIFTILAGITGGLIYFAYNITQFTTYDSNTRIANIYIGGLFGNEAETELQKEVTTWTNDANIYLKIQDHTIKLDNKKFQFNVKNSIKDVRNGHDNKLIVTISEEEYIKQTILNNYSVIKYNKFDYEKINSDLLSNVSKLKYNIYIDLGLYIDNYSENRQLIDTQYITNYSQAQALGNKFDTFVGEIVIEPKTQFSFIKFINEKVKTYDIEKNGRTYNNSFTNDELTVIASGMYKLALKSNFNNFSKQTSNQFPNYLQSGLEAHVFDAKYVSDFELEKNPNLLSNEVKDFTFWNPNSYPLYITISYSSTHQNQNVPTLEFRLYGLPFINTYTYDYLTNSIVIQHGFVYIYEETWNNQPVVNDINHFIGRDGYRTLVTRTITYPDGRVETILLFEDYYKPVESIIIRNPNRR